jgi:PadR family transcriptional regulator PadR
MSLPPPVVSHLDICKLSAYLGRVTNMTAAMREPTYCVLAALLDEPLPGYAIIKRAAELSGDRVRLATGTLYTALARLAAEGHARLVSEQIVSGQARRSHGLTGSGAAALRAEAARMEHAARVVTRHQRRQAPGAGQACPA